MNVFDLFAKISIDTRDYEEGIDGAKNKSTTFFDVLKANLTSQAIIGGVKKISSAFADLGKSAINAYADYEQLTGGVETLFKTSSDIVMQYADNAYKTAGLSANNYMETVTSFSASLLQSLGGDTEKAAQTADLAITDMADNANKMGTAMESIQNAYQGFAKQNYTMLDNLKLGYGGTKEEMARLLEDAAKLKGLSGVDAAIYANKGVNGDLASIIDAIHTIQTEMGITGTTALEASSTIQGSIASMKAAWANFIGGMADPDQDFDALLGGLVDSVVTVGDNLLPRIQMLLPRLLDGLTQLASNILPYIPPTLQTLLPALIDGATSLISGLVDVLPDILTTAINAVPQLIESAGELITVLANGIAKSLPELIPTIVDVVLQIVETLIDNVDMLVDAAIAITVALAEGLINALPRLIEKAPVIVSKLVTAIVENVPKLLTAAWELIKSLATGLIENLPEIGKAALEIVNTLAQGIADLWESIKDVGKNIVMGIWDGISAMATWIKEKVTGFFGGIVDGVKGFLGIHSPSTVFADVGKNMALGLGEGWDDEFSSIKKGITSGLDFGTANVDFAASGLGVSSAGIVNGLSSGFDTERATGPFIINLSTGDGQKLATWLLPELIGRAKANGTPIVNPA